MKPLLRTLLLLTAVGYSYVVNAQTGACGVTDLVVENIRQVGTTGCTYQFDVAFTLTGSQGHKYVFFQSYLQGAYNDYFDCDLATNTTDIKKPPELNDFDIQPLVNAVIDVSGATPVFSPEYLPDPRVPIRGVVTTPPPAGLVVSTVDTVQLDGEKEIRYILNNLTVTLQDCDDPLIFVTDIFATNARSANQAQCVSCGLHFATGFFTPTLLRIEECSPPRLAAILTNNTTTAITGTYSVYEDINDNNHLTIEGGIDILLVGPTAFTIPAGGEALLTPSLNVPPYTGGSIFLVIDQNITAGGINTTARTVLFVDQIAGCSPLPVKMKSFTATRKNQNVELVWETASEDNNRGFYVQRNNGSGWKDLGFVASKAPDGNSIGDLSYNYTDANNTSKGVTQYRIMQVDIDGKAKLSEIRQVRGLAQTGQVTVYPNPSGDGKVNVVFDDSKAIWNVSVADMNGRIIKQLKGVTNSVVVDNLLPGMYMVRIVDTQTGAQTAEKVIINNH